MKTLSILSLAIFTLLFTNCDETKKVIEVAGTVQLSGNYSVIKVGNAAIKGEALYFTFAALDNSINGNTGCNSFFGNYTLDGFTLDFGDLAVSERYCDEPIMESERALLGALNNTGSYMLKDKVLTFYSKEDRAVILTAKKAITQED